MIHHIIPAVLKGGTLARKIMPSYLSASKQINYQPPKSMEVN